MSSATPLPRIAVLLATHNGREWLPEQLASILNQRDVDVRVIALDDESTDGTREWLIEQSATDARLTVLPSQGRSGGSAPNFYRLLASADYAPDELIAFADQDDVWVEGKLARHAALMASGGYDGVSSNVTSFTHDGTRTLVRKNFPQRRFDYLLESPGPGSTFLISYRLADRAREVLADAEGAARKVDFHDSLLYVIGRASGWSWLIDSVSSVDYRQHESNVMGANVGVRSAIARLRLIRGGWFRGHAVALARVAMQVAPDGIRPELEKMLSLFEQRGVRARLRLAGRVGLLRRRVRDQGIIAVLVLIGVW